MVLSGALDELLQCLQIKHPDRAKAIEITKSVFTSSDERSARLIKEDLGRRITSKKYYLFEKKWARIEEGKYIVRSTAVLEFLKEMALTKDEMESSFQSTISMDKTSHFREGRPERTASTVSTISAPMSARRPIYESTPRNATQTSTSMSSTWKRRTTTEISSLHGPPDGPILTKAQLVRDTLFAMEDIPGTYLIYNESTNTVRKYKVKDQYRVDVRDASLVEALGALGFYVRQINDFIKQNERQDAFGMIGNGLLRSLSVEISEYRFALSNFRILPDLTLIYLKTATEKWATKLEHLYLLVYNLENLRGGEILSVLHTFVAHGHPMIRQMYRNVFDACSRPYLVQLNMWMYSGVLHDPFNEFLVAADLKQPVEHFWTSRYRLELKYLPNFITPNQAEKIVLIGKSINFLREVCSQSEFISPKEMDGGKGVDIVTEVANKIKNTYESTSMRLLTVLNEVYSLPAHFSAMRSYMLLGHGDFVLHLLESLQKELCKPADELFRRNLAEHVETAISLTNAQYDNHEVLKCIDVRLHGINPGDVGWDIFSLNYTVEGPLLTIFPTDVMKKYIRVFNFLLRAKRMEFNLNSNWGKMMSVKQYAREIPEAKEVFFISNILSSEMTHLISQLQYYIHFEIIETSWSIFANKVENANDLDEVIIAHLAFLNELEQGCLLADTLWDKIKSLRSIFDQIVRFESGTKKIFDAITTEAEFRRTVESKSNSGIFTQEDEQLEIERRLVFKQNMFAQKCWVGHLRHTYQNMVRDFLSSLTDDKVQILSCLAWRIDYNGFYEKSRV